MKTVPFFGVHRVTDPTHHDYPERVMKKIGCVVPGCGNLHVLQHVRGRGFCKNHPKEAAAAQAAENRLPHFLDCGEENKDDE